MQQAPACECWCGVRRCAAANLLTRSTSSPPPFSPVTVVHLTLPQTTQRPNSLSECRKSPASSFVPPSPPRDVYPSGYALVTGAVPSKLVATRSSGAHDRRVGGRTVDAHLPEMDPRIAFFAKPGFDATAYVASAMRADAAGGGSGVGSTLEETAAEVELRHLRGLEAEVDREIRAIVTTHHATLATHHTASAAMKADVEGLSAKVTELRHVAGRLRDDVLTPVEDLRRDVRLLRHATQAAELLSAVQEALGLVGRLQAGFRALAADADSAALPLGCDARALGRLAPQLYDAEQLVADCGARLRLAQVRVLQQPLQWLHRAGATYRTALRDALDRAAGTLNVADVGALLDAAADLGDDALQAACVRCIDHAAHAAAVAWSSALNPTALAQAAQAALEGTVATPATTVPTLTGGGPAVTSAGAGGVSRAGGSAGATSVAPPPTILQPSVGAAAAWRGVLWGRVEEAGDGLQRATLQAWNLAWVVGLRHHSASRARLAARLDGEAVLAGTSEDGRGSTAGDDGPPLGAAALLTYGPAALLRRYWCHATHAMHAACAALLTSDQGAFIRTSLLDAYPRLHYTLLDVLGRVERSAALRSGSEDAGNLSISLASTGTMPGTSSAGTGAGGSAQRMGGVELLQSTCDQRRGVVGRASASCLPGALPRAADVRRERLLPASHLTRCPCAVQVGCPAR